MDVLLIVNPFASEVTEERVRAVERALERSAAVTTLLTERPGHAAELAAGAAGVDALIVFSGDGGFN
jgi:diacylglycerol kinase family enzyme